MAMYTILIVDDNPNNLFTLRTLLQANLDADVIEAESGYAALEQITQQKIDLILLDIQMSGMDGFETARLIRNRKRYQDIPIIFLTAVYKSDEFKEKGLAGGAIDYLTKPIDEPMLINRVKAYLRLLESERAINLKLQAMNDQLQAEIEERTRMGQELERLNQQLQEASQYKTDFLSNMSHELRTPLNAVIGYIGLAVSTLKTTLAPEQLENLLRAERSARTLLQLINDVLDFSKIEAGKMDVFVEEVDLSEILEEVALTAEGLLLGKPVAVKNDIAPQLPSVQSDYTKVKQILNNIVGNAIKFTLQGYVALHAKGMADGTAVRIEVEDTGGGIPPEKLDTLFQAYTQADSSIKKKFGGTGLGLAITKSFCDMLGIAIGVTSDVGKGTVFWLEIPVQSTIMSAERSPSIESVDQTPDIEWSDVRRLSNDRDAESSPQAMYHSVLIVDDEEMNRLLLESIFESQGYLVATASSGREAVEQARAAHPDVIIMDVAMPDMDGYEATQTLKRDPATATIVVIACSAMANEELEREAYQAGCDGFIRKPIEPEELLNQVASFVAKRNA